MTTQARLLFGSRGLIRGWLAGLIFFGVLMAAAIAVFVWVSPNLATRQYLAATYTGEQAPQDANTRVVTPGLDRSVVRVSAFFGLDPDYSNLRAAADGAAYRGDVVLMRRGLRWLPAEGGVLSSGATYGFFNGHWLAVDPQVEQARGPDEACG